MRKPLVCLVVLGLSAGLAAPSLAAAPKKLAKAKPLVVQDAVGDANGFNNQGGLVPVSPPEQSNGSVNQKQADIVSFSLGRLDNGKVVSALVGKMTFTGPPAQATDYRIRMSAPGCSTYFMEYDFAPALGASGYIRHNCDGGTTSVFDPVDVVVAGNTITWTVPVKGMPGGVKLGDLLSVTGAQTSLDSGVAIFPGIDQVVVDTSYKIGQ